MENIHVDLALDLQIAQSNSSCVLTTECTQKHGQDQRPVFFYWVVTQEDFVPRNCGKLVFWRVYEKNKK